MFNTDPVQKSRVFFTGLLQELPADVIHIHVQKVLRNPFQRQTGIGIMFPGIENAFENKFLGSMAGTKRVWQQLQISG